jgi:hypothetical protein
MLGILAVLLCGFILITGCFSIPQLGVKVEDIDNRSRIIPFYGLIENETNGVISENSSISDATTETTTPKEGFTITDYIIGILILLVGSYAFLKIVEWILKKIRLEDQPPLVP